jgi:hypothetical protein
MVGSVAIVPCSVCLALLMAVFTQDVVFFVCTFVVCLLGCNVVDMLNTTDLELSEAKCLPAARTVISSKNSRIQVVIAGGQLWNNPAQYSNLAEIFDVDHNTWSVHVLACGDRDHIASAASGSKAFFCGGSHDAASLSCSKCCDMYDADSQSWSAADMSVVHNDGGAAVVAGLLLVAGGNRCDGTGYQTVDILNISSGLWSTGQISQGCQRAVGTSASHFAFFSSLTRLEIFDASNSSWWWVPFPDSGNFDNACSIELLNVVLFAAQDTNVIEIYNYVTNTFSQAYLSSTPGGGGISMTCLGTYAIVSVSGRSVALFDVLARAWSQTTVASSLIHTAMTTAGLHCGA